MRVPGRQRRTTWTVLVVATLLVTAACAPAPGDTTGDGGNGAGAVVPTEWFLGGSYPVEIVVEPQTVTTEFSFFGLATCTTTSVTPSVDLRGTLTVQPAQLDASLTRLTIPGARLELPDASVSAGSLSLHCDDVLIGAVGVSLRFDAAVQVGSVVLDTTAGTLTLTDPTLTLDDVQVTFSGAPPGTAPTPLAPITVTVPSIEVPV
jgi:hypothetical protein